MSSFLMIAILIFFVSCSSGRIDRKFEDSSLDSLADESYMRWGEKRLESGKKDGPQVIGCYLGESNKILEDYRNDYLSKGQDLYYWIHIGNCYFIQESWAKAEFFYRMALEESKSKIVKSIALNNLALLHFKYEEWDKGKQLLNDSIIHAPHFKVPKFNLSQLYLQFGLYERAIKVLTDPIFRGHHDIDILFSLANAYLYKGDLKNSEHYFKMIPAQYFRREDIAATYSLYLIKMGKLHEAKSMMDQRKRSDVAEITAISHQIEKMIASRLKEE